MKAKSAPITVGVPVGPHPANSRWLREALDSIATQTLLPDQVVVIADGAHLDLPLWSDPPFNVVLWETPWVSGIAHAFNFCVALARNNLVLMLGSDDRLEAWAVADCWAAWQQRQNRHGYYYLDIQYSDGRTQSLASNAAMVHKDLWHLTGGLPPESAAGQCDTVLVSSILAAKGRLGNLHRVASKRPPYWYRVHDETDTATRPGKLRAAAALVREHYTELAAAGNQTQ
jgi:hypothetical protein